MKNRQLIILIVVLYIASAISLLGVGIAREKLKDLRTSEQQMEEERLAQEREELQNKLLIWQGVAVVLFGSASLLLVFKNKLVKISKKED